MDFHRGPLKNLNGKKSMKFVKRFLKLHKITVTAVEKVIAEGNDINKVNSKGNNALHSVVLERNYHLAVMLLYHGVDPNVPNNLGYTPFMLALLHETHEIQLLLLDYETDFNRTSKKGESILYLAVKYRSKLTDKLLDKGATIFSCPRLSGLCSLNVFKSIDILKLIWDRIDYENIQWGRYDTAIGYAIYHDFPEMFEFVVNSDKLQRILDDTYAMESRNQLKFIRVYSIRGLSYAAIKGLIDFIVLHFSKQRAHEIIYKFISLGYKPDYMELEKVFENFGRSGLFDLCLDTDVSRSNLTYTYLLPCIILDVSKTLKEHIKIFIKDRIRKLNPYELVENAEQVAPYLKDDVLITKLKQMFVGQVKHMKRVYPNMHDFAAKMEVLRFKLDKIALGKLNHKVSSLQELSRNVAREFICNKYNVTEFSALRKVLRAMNIGDFGKILAFEKPIDDNLKL